MDPRYLPARRVAWSCIALFVALEVVVKAIVDLVVSPAVSDITRSLDVAIALGITLIGTAVRASFISWIVARRFAERRGYHERSELWPTLLLGALGGILFNYVGGPLVSVATGALGWDHILQMSWLIATEAAAFAAFALVPIALMPEQAVARRREAPRVPGALGRG